MTRLQPPEWHRVHPLALVFFFLALLRDLVRQAVSLLPLVVLLALNETVRSLALPWGVLVAVVLSLVVTVLRYALFRFQVTSDRIHVRQGVMQRQALTLEFSHIQQADTRVPWYYRPFGLANLSLDSLGSQQQAVVLSGITLVEANQLKNTVLQQASTTADDEHTGQDDFKLALAPPDVLRYGLMHNGLLLLLPLILPFANQLMPLVEQPLSEVWARTAPNGLLVQATPGAPAITLLVVLLGLVLFVVVSVSVLLGLVRYFGYTLTRRGDRWQYQAGLLSLTARSVRAHRIQLLVFRESWIGRLLRRQSLVINKAGEVQAEAESEGRFVVPVLNPTQQRQLSDQLSLPHEAHWQRVSWAYALGRWVIWCVLLTLLVIGLLGETLEGQHAWAWLSMIGGLGLVVALVHWQRWRRLGVH
ncbi:MAG: PH domain-containing protein, partial [Natronospirillum sp.]